MILLLDGNYVCQRVLYTDVFIPSKDEIPSEFLQSLMLVMDKISRYSSDLSNIIVCWDSRISFRKQASLEYKANRGLDRTESEKEKFDLFFVHLHTFRDILDKIGIVSIEIEGLEGDDIVAMAKNRIRKDSDESILFVSNDQDLYQLIDKDTTMLKPVKGGYDTYDLEDFRSEWGIEPEEWILVKAIGGCKTDNVSGLEHVKERTAIKILKGIKEVDEEALEAVINKNLHLVQLPYQDMEIESIGQSKVNREVLEDICYDYIMPKINTDAWIEEL